MMTINKITISILSIFEDLKIKVVSKINGWLITIECQSFFLWKACSNKTYRLHWFYIKLNNLCYGNHVVLNFMKKTGWQGLYWFMSADLHANVSDAIEICVNALVKPKMYMFMPKWSVFNNCLKSYSVFINIKPNVSIRWVETF